MYQKLKKYCSFSAIALSVLCAGAHAETKYPERPITITVGYGAGGASDSLVRVLADSAAKTLGQPTIVENQPGAGSSIQATRLVRATPDGYTIGSVLVGAVINQYMRETEYDLANDLTPIIMFANLPYGVVAPADKPWKTFKELVDFAKANPNSIRYGTAGIGSTQHLTMELLGKKLGIDWIHVPYKSGPETIMAAIRGDVDIAAQSAEWAPFVRDGRMRALAMFNAERYAEFPDVPTLMELGYDISAPSMIGFAGPKGMKPEDVKVLHDAFHKAMQDPKFANTVKANGWQVDYKNTADFAKYIKQMDEHYSTAVKTAGLAK